jgi:hypothetical protein
VPRALDESLDRLVAHELAQLQGLLTGDERRHGGNVGRAPDGAATLGRRGADPGTGVR